MKLNFQDYDSLPPEYLPPVEIMDANGLQIRSVLWCDTETGEVERVVLDEEGQSIVENGDIKTVAEKYGAPLRIRKVE